MEITSQNILVIKNEYPKKIARATGKILGKYLRIIYDLAHKFIDRVLAILLYNLFRTLGRVLFLIESKLNEYLKKSKYVKDDQYERKIDEGRLILLGMGLMDVHRITLREISYLLNVSDFYARQIKDIAKNWTYYWDEYKRIMKSYESDSEKKDKRSKISKKVYFD